ncbi:MAG: ribosome maturation factor RimP [Bacillota bacterium]|nr:ribosome maturation factor RimP [Bacillota bacterium]
MPGKIEKLVHELIAPVIENMGFFLVDVELKKEGKQKILYIFVDKKGGIAIEDCEAISREAEKLLDAHDPIEERYYLCVSSPGLDRPFKTDTDYERNISREIEVRLYTPVEGKKELTGILKAYDAETITLDTGSEELKIKKSGIALVRQTVRF